MKSPWQLQDAKNRLSELVEKALHDGPQIITRRGKKTAVVVSFEEYRKLVAAVAIRWGALDAAAERDGRRVPVVDGLLAATSAVHGLTLATRNAKHFEKTGIKVVDPWGR